MANNCSKCYGQRWVFAALKWSDDSATCAWQPFDRANWKAYGTLVLSVALAAKTLRPCDCNPKRLAPWAKSWEIEATNATAPAAQTAGIDGSF